ncbi:hypothetical protein [Bradyrhizobium sp.]|uniref:hypothetical protein n=1 Tax=Bradyrhizobium sp. TaxID=376 RepID=UPI0039E25528
MGDDSKRLNALVLVISIVAVWNGAIIAGTAYIVFWKGYSGWWWLLALVLLNANASELIGKLLARGQQN